MTDTRSTVEELAERVAAGGREELLSRLRRAYADAAAAHSDIVTLDSSRIEAMVQSAADRADGLQWRRALANVAMKELGVSLADALNHPSVARAQELVGAPSYEASLAELVARPVPPARASGENGGESRPRFSARIEEITAAVVTPAARPDPVTAMPTVQMRAEELPVAEQPEPEAELAPIEEPEPERSQPEAVIEEPEPHGATGELDMVEADDTVLELLPEPEPIEYETELYEEPALQPAQAQPPLLEQVPFVPEPEQPPYAEPEPLAVADEPNGQHLGQPTQPHMLEHVDPPAHDADAVLAPVEVDSYGAQYGGEHFDYPPATDGELRITAHHLGGVANLPTGRNGLDMRLSDQGLDILKPEGEIIGRLHWEEIDSLEVVSVRSRLRRQAKPQSRIVVRTKHGDATFEIPGVSSEELKARVEPLRDRYALGA